MQENLRMCAQAEAYRLLSEASQRLEASAKTGGAPDSAAEEAAHTGMAPQANSIMSAAKCSVLLSNMQVPTSRTMLCNTAYTSLLLECASLAERPMLA